MFRFSRGFYEYFFIPGLTEEEAAQLVTVVAKPKENNNTESEENKIEEDKNNTAPLEKHTGQAGATQRVIPRFS